MSDGAAIRQEEIHALMASYNRSLAGRIGAHALHGRYNARETTAPARRAFMGRFEREADPDGVLGPDERRRRAAHLKKVYFLRLSLKSAEARRGRATRRSARPS